MAETRPRIGRRGAAAQPLVLWYCLMIVCWWRRVREKDWFTPQQRVSSSFVDTASMQPLALGVTPGLHAAAGCEGLDGAHVLPSSGSGVSLGPSLLGWLALSLHPARPHPGARGSQHPPCAARGPGLGRRSLQHGGRAPRQHRRPVRRSPVLQVLVFNLDNLLLRWKG